MFDDESKEIVDSHRLLGAPATPVSLLRLQSGQRKPKGSLADKGLTARTAEPDQQRLQVLSVVNTATQDLGAIINKKSTKSAHISLEEAVKFINGGEDVLNDESASALLGAVASAQDS